MQQGKLVKRITVSAVYNSWNSASISFQPSNSQVNEILDISALTSSETSLAAITNFQFSVWLGDADVGAATGSAVINGKTLDNSNGKTAMIKETNAIVSDGSNIGLTAKDFESFRAAAQASNAALQAKIDQILDTGKVGC